MRACCGAPRGRRPLCSRARGICITWSAGGAPAYQSNQTDVACTRCSQLDGAACHTYGPGVRQGPCWMACPPHHATSRAHLGIHLRTEELGQLGCQKCPDTLESLEVAAHMHKRHRVGMQFCLSVPQKDLRRWSSRHSSYSSQSRRRGRSSSSLVQVAMAIFHLRCKEE